MMNKAKQLYLAMICEFPANHELVREAVSDPAAAEQLRQGVRITKADIFDLLSNGKSIFEYDEAWRKFDQIVNVVRMSGDSVSFGDFSKLARVSKTVMDLAVEKGVADKLFSPELWRNRSERDFISAWFEIERLERDRYDFMKIRRAFARAQGRDVREDQLEKFGVRREDILADIRSGDFSDTNQKLARHGDKLRKDDLFLLDHMGDNMLNQRNAWYKLDALLAQLEKNGEHLDFDDLTFCVKGRRSIIQTATDQDDLSKIFFAPLWRDRLPEMIRLYNHVGTIHRNRQQEIKIHAVLDEVAQLQYGAALKEKKIADKADLLAVVNEADKGVGPYFYRPVIALGLKAAWDNIDAIREDLRAKGQKISLSDLRKVSGFAGDACLVGAVRNGHFSKVLEILDESGEYLSAADLTAKGRDDKSIIDILADKDQMDVLLSPSFWAAHPGDFLPVWNAIPTSQKLGFELKDLQAEINRLALRRRFVQRPQQRPAP